VDYLWAVISSTPTRSPWAERSPDGGAQANEEGEGQ
jgi:hypothetical protein